MPPARSFNSRAREGRDLPSRGLRLSTFVRFNSRAREGRDIKDGTFIDKSTVSIHAPARGATRGGCKVGSGDQGFNSRAREGRDSPLAASLGVDPVSIHAPARGATLAISLFATVARGFNSRAREGRDPAHGRMVDSPRCFNSRAREGRDQCLQPGQSTRAVSIHAPARGATVHIDANTTIDVFQFTRPRGARQAAMPHRGPSERFNSRAREGRDRRKSGACTR